MAKWGLWLGIILINRKIDARFIKIYAMWDVFCMGNAIAENIYHTFYLKMVRFP